MDALKAEARKRRMRRKISWSYLLRWSLHQIYKLINWPILQLYFLKTMIFLLKRWKKDFSDPSWPSKLSKLFIDYWLTFRGRMPESRSSCWMNFSLGMAGLGVVMGVTVFFVFRSVKIPLNIKGPLYSRLQELSFHFPAFCTATSTLVCGHLEVGFLLPSFSTCTSSSWTTGVYIVNCTGVYNYVHPIFINFLLYSGFPHGTQCTASLQTGTLVFSPWHSGLSC